MVWLVSFDSEIRNQAPLALTNFGIGTLEGDSRFTLTPFCVNVNGSRRKRSLF